MGTNRRSQNCAIAYRSAWQAPLCRRRGLLVGALAASFAPDEAVADPAFNLHEIAPGVHVHFGQIALTTPANQGDIANLGILIGQDAVAVVDTGGSVAVGKQLAAAVRALTEKPVRYVINTHEHPDHVFGNAAFAPGPTFVGHRRLPIELAARAEYYLRSYRDQLGPRTVAEVRIIPPALLVQNELTLNLGGRRLRLNAWGPAHSGCDLTVLDEASGILFAGDLLFLDHVPVVDDSLKGWLGQMPELAAVPARTAVPGHGQRAAPWPAALSDERRYLETLAADARAALAAGTPLAKAVPRIAQSERGRWQLFDDYNPRNATAAFGQLEWE